MMRTSSGGWRCGSHSDLMSFGRNCGLFGTVCRISVSRIVFDGEREKGASDPYEIYQ